MDVFLVNNKEPFNCLKKILYTFKLGIRMGLVSLIFHKTSQIINL